MGGCECVAKDPVLATTEIKCEDDYYLSETPRPLLRLQPHPPMPSPESEPEDIESDDASAATTTTTEDTESYDIEVPLRWNDNPGTTTRNMSLPRSSQPKTRLLPEGPSSPSSGSPTQSHDDEGYWRRYAAQIQHENDSFRKQLTSFEQRITRAEKASDDAMVRLMESCSRNEKKLREKLETAESKLQGRKEIMVEYDFPKLERDRQK